MDMEAWCGTVHWITNCQTRLSDWTDNGFLKLKMYDNGKNNGRWKNNNLRFSQQMCSVQFSSVAQLCPTLRPHESQHSRPPCPLPTPGVHPNTCPLSQWCHPAISSSVSPFSSCPQSLPASGSFPMCQLFTWGDQSIGVSASSSVLPMNTQDLSPLGWTSWISL